VTVCALLTFLSESSTGSFELTLNTLNKDRMSLSVAAVAVVLYDIDFARIDHRATQLLIGESRQLCEL